MYLYVCFCICHSNIIYAYVFNMEQKSLRFSGLELDREYNRSDAQIPVQD